MPILRLSRQTACHEGALLDQHLVCRDWGLHTRYPDTRHGKVRIMLLPEGYTPVNFGVNHSRPLPGLGFGIE